MPSNPGPLEPYLEMVEPLGRVSHAEMPAWMRQADVFVFPSLFEGSAVVTYEALASGLPCVVTAESGSVVRDGLEGFVVGGATSPLWPREWKDSGAITICAPHGRRRPCPRAGL